MDKDLNTGLFLINKPQGMSSFKALYPIKRLFKKHRVGHAGTLDVEATGLLVVAVGKATRLVDLIHAKSKTYEFKIILGKTSNSYDLFGNVTDTGLKYKGSLDDIQTVVNSEFVGNIQQAPPIFSSVKYQGTRAYKLARHGLDMNLQSKLVVIKSFEILKYNYPKIECRVICSKGTYVRSLAHDLGQKLGCGGVADKIHRTQIGEFALSSALEVDSVVDQNQLMPLESYFGEIKPIQLEDEQMRLVTHGQTIKCSVDIKINRLVKLLNTKNKWIALGEQTSEEIGLKSMLTIL